MPENLFDSKIWGAFCGWAEGEQRTGTTFLHAMPQVPLHLTADLWSVEQSGKHKQSVMGPRNQTSKSTPRRVYGQWPEVQAALQSLLEACALGEAILGTGPSCMQWDTKFKADNELLRTIATSNTSQFGVCEDPFPTRSHKWESREKKIWLFSLWKMTCPRSHC